MILIIRMQSSSGERTHLLNLLRQATGNQRPINLTTIDEHEVIALDESQVDGPTRLVLTQPPGIERVVHVTPPYKLVSTAFKAERSRIKVGDASRCQAVTIGGEGSAPVVIAGPCAVESREQLLTTARSVKAAGAQILRGGAFKPRTSPYQFQGLGVEGLHLLAEARELTGLPVITEVMEPDMVETVAQYADVLQIGSRNMQNFPLLLAAGRSRLQRPVMLKRGISATIEEWLLAAEYIVAAGNPNVILCERGIRSFDQHTRNLLDLTCVPLLQELTHLPVIVDPSHATGRRELVPTMSRASIAAGGAGLVPVAGPHRTSPLCGGWPAISPRAL